MEKTMALHSSTLAWKIPWTEEPGRLQSMGSLRVGHNWATSLSLFTFMHWRRKWQPTPVFLPGESQGQGNLVGCRLWGCRVGHDWSDLAVADGSIRVKNEGWMGWIFIASLGLIQDTGCLGLVHWDDPERWYGEGGRRGVQNWELMDTRGRFLSSMEKPIQFYKVK